MKQKCKKESTYLHSKRIIIQAHLQRNSKRIKLKVKNQELWLLNNKSKKNNWFGKLKINLCIFYGEKIIMIIIQS